MSTEKSAKAGKIGIISVCVRKKAKAWPATLNHWQGSRNYIREGRSGNENRVDIFLSKYFLQINSTGYKSENPLILILDEIQTGLGRTGTALAEEHEGIEADLTLIGKALSGGFYSVSAVLSNKEVLEILQPGQHGSTFGGNPLACSVARAALKVLTDEGMIENARDTGAYFLAELKKIENKNIKDIRGRGLMIAIELHEGTQGGARAIAEKLQVLGILCKETHSYTIRFAPPLVIKKEEADWALKRINQVFAQ